MKFKFLDIYYCWQLERSKTYETKNYPNFPKKLRATKITQLMKNLITSVSTFWESGVRPTFEQNHGQFSK